MDIQVTKEIKRKKREKNDGTCSSSTQIRKSRTTSIIDIFKKGEKKEKKKLRQIQVLHSIPLGETTSGWSYKPKSVTESLSLFHCLVCFFRTKKKKDNSSTSISRFSLSNQRHLTLIFHASRVALHREEYLGISTTTSLQRCWALWHRGVGEKDATTHSLLCDFDRRNIEKKENKNFCLYKTSFSMASLYYLSAEILFRPSIYENRSDPGGRYFSKNKSWDFHYFTSFFFATRAYAGTLIKNTKSLFSPISKGRRGEGKKVNTGQTILWRWKWFDEAVLYLSALRFQDSFFFCLRPQMELFFLKNHFNEFAGTWDGKRYITNSLRYFFFFFFFYPACFVSLFPRPRVIRPDQCWVNDRARFSPRLGFEVSL